MSIAGSSMVGTQLAITEYTSANGPLPVSLGLNHVVGQPGSVRSVSIVHFFRKINSPSLSKLHDRSYSLYKIYS